MYRILLALCLTNIKINFTLRRNLKMTTKKTALSAKKIVESHKPKHVKFKYIFKDDDFLNELISSEYDMDSLDTIQNDALVQEALKAECNTYYRDTVAHAKEPTVLDDGIILSKKLVTKADKKLLALLLGFFEYNYIKYIILKLQYEKFDIVEIFILT